MVMADNIGEKLKKLKEIEAEELAELKQKRILEAEAVKKDNDRRATEKLLAKLRKEKEMVCRDLEETRKKNLTLQLECDSWECAKKKMMEDLKMAEKTLNEKHEEIWKEREIFCNEADKYLDECGMSSKWWKERMKIINDHQEFNRYYLSTNLMKKETEKYQAVVKELEKDVKILKNKLEQEEADKMKNDVLLRELEMEKENLANEVKGSCYNNMIENTEKIKKHCHELTKLIAEKERDLKSLENPLLINSKISKMRFQSSTDDFGGKVEEETNLLSASDTPLNASNVFEEASSFPADFEEEMEISPIAEIKQPESFLFEMLDPSTIRAARAKAKTKSKPQSLSTMTPQERIRKLQVSFNDFLSKARK